MSRPSTKVTGDYEFPVKMVQLRAPNGRATAIHAVQREDTGHVYPTAFTSQYGIIRHDDLVGMVEKGLAENNLTDFRRDISVADEGARLYARYDFKNIEKSVAKVGDTIGFRLTLRNSYDGTLMAGFMSGALCLACTNGMVRSKSEFGFMKKHFVSLSLDTIQIAIQNAINHFDRLIGEYGQMAGVNLTDEQGVIILKNLEKENILSGKLREEIEARWLSPTTKDNDEHRSVWGLYNASTAQMRDLQTTRFEYSLKVNERLGNAFTQIAGSTNRLQQFLIAPPTEVVAAN